MIDTLLSRAGGSLSDFSDDDDDDDDQIRSELPVSNVHRDSR